MKVYIMRGLPGSGKTTWVKNNTVKDKTAIVSADYFFTFADGSYKFAPELLPKAHASCLRGFITLVQAYERNRYNKLWYDTIVVDNTNIRLEDFSPYYRIAEAYELDVEIVHCIAPVIKCIQENVHGVPESTIIKMAASMSEFPDNTSRGWKVKLALRN